jgi:alkaline phosphatase
MVPVFAYGPGAEAFSGIYENTEVFDKLLKLLDLK